MDAIRGIKDTAIDRINMPTLAALIPILDEKKAEIDKIERREFKYGDKERHYLDVYYPPAACASNEKLPVLFFVYGGGYNTGSRRFPEPYDMGYRALGSFFAARGFLTVIPDYRLVPEVRFPSASEDLRDALIWVAGHAAEVVGAATDGRSARREMDLENMFMLAHSAGAAHAFVLHAYAPLRASLRAVTGLRVRGLVLSGCPWYFGVRGEKFATTGPTKSYFGGEGEQKESEPRALWRALGEEEVGGFPEVLLVQAEREPDWLRVETRAVMEMEMREKLARVGKTMRETYVAAGHNHVSLNWVLGTGDEEGEKWARDVVVWIQQCCSTRP